VTNFRPTACKFAQILAKKKKKKIAISLQNGPKLMLKTAIKLENLAKLDGGCRIPSKSEIFGLFSLQNCPNSC
jgi:hypothetical protein